MSKSKPITDEILIQAAEMRAGGAKWEAVAQALSRSVDTVSAWPRKYAERWQELLKVAEKRTLGDASAELIHVLRIQLRSKDEKTARDAAKSLTDLRLGLSKLDQSDNETPVATVTSDAARFTAFVDGHPDEQLARYDAALRSLPAAPVPVPDEPCPRDSVA